MKKIELFILLPILLLTVAFLQVQVFKGAEKVVNTQEEQYYDLEDFGSVKSLIFMFI